MELYHAVYRKAIVEIEVEEICFVKAKDRDEARKKVIEEERFGNKVYSLPFSQSFLSKTSQDIHDYGAEELLPLHEFINLGNIKEIRIYDPVTSGHIFDLDDIQNRDFWTADSIEEVKERFDNDFIVLYQDVAVGYENEVYFAMFNQKDKEKYYLSIR